MTSVIAASIDRLASSRPGGLAAYAGALAIVGTAIVILELCLADLDHGTHLLAGLIVVAGAALLFGPGPATSGLMAGAGMSVVVAGAMVEGILASPHTYIQLVMYMVAGGSIILLATLALRARAMGRPAPSRVAPLPAAVMAEALTERELEILRLAASGIPVDEIAERIFVSPNTVKTHLTHLYAKLGVRGRPDAVRAALHYGCLTPADICPHRFPPESLESPVPVSEQHRNG